MVVRVKFTLFILIGTVMIFGDLEEYQFIVGSVMFCAVGYRLIFDVFTLANREVDNGSTID